MAVGIGHKSYLQIGRESTYGTAVAATERIEIINFNATPTIGVIKDPSLNDQVSRRALYQGGYNWKGTVSVRWNYGGVGFLQLLDGVFGTATYATKGAATSGAGPYTHTFTELPEQNSYTLEVGEGDIPTTKVAQYKGVIFSGFTATLAAGTADTAMLKADFSWIATSRVENQTPTGALTAPTPNPVLYHQATTVDDGVNVTGSKIRSLDIGYTQPLDENRFYLGALNVLQPVRSDFLEPTFRMSMEYADTSHVAVAQTFTTGSPEFVFTQSTNTVTFRMSEAVMTEFSKPVEGYGVLLQTVTRTGFRTTGNADDSAMTVVVVNADAWA